MYLKGLLAHILNTSIPSGRKVHVCHACHNELCSNPYHIYWGTPSENVQDAIENGTRISIWESLVKKYGYEEACRRNSRPPEKAALGGKGNLGKTKTKEHKSKISNAISNQVCYTNGYINKKQHKDHPAPVGFWKGMTRNVKKQHDLAG